MDTTASTTLITFFLLFPSLCSSAGDKIELGEQLLPGQTRASDGGAFVLGFFSPSNSTPEKQYIGIWYNIPDRTVVWVANRETPAITTTTTTNQPRFVLTTDSNLVLSDSDGRVIWTTNVTGVSKSNSPPVAELLSTGNLVVRSPNGTILWQSFDHPTDTFIPEMKVNLNKRTKRGRRIVSWNDAAGGDPSPGRFSYGMDPDTSLQLVLLNGSTPYWRTTVWTGYLTSGQPLGATGTTIYLDVVDADEEIYMKLRASDGAAPTRYVVTSSGEFKLMSWSKTSSEWITFTSFPSHQCSTYGFCGPNGYCDFASSTCKCLDGFEPASGIAGRFSRGCRRKEAAPCGGSGRDFLALPTMKVPDKFRMLMENMTFDECAARCGRNCTCEAYAYASLGETSRCLVWAGELLDMAMIGQTAWGRASETLFLRVPAATGSKI